MLYYTSPGPLCNICEYCSIPQHRPWHWEQFKAISVSPVTGIVFKAYHYSASQLADAFEKIISGHMDFEIKRHALDRWNILLPPLLDGPLWRESEFELQDFFLTLDDFLFLRALRHRCRVEWVDRYKTGQKRDWNAWCASGADETNLQPVVWIRLVRPTVDIPMSVQECLCALMHEMCHAVFAFKCCYNCCSCPLKKMNSEGLSGHGPSWEKIRRSVEKTASLHLKGLGDSVKICHWSEPQVEIEQKKATKMLSDLYKKITQQGSESAIVKRLERCQRWSDRAKLLANIQNEQTEEERLDAIACAAAMFRSFERERVFDSLVKHVTCLSSMMEKTKLEDRSPELMEALEYVETVILKKQKDGGYGSEGYEDEEIYMKLVEGEKSG